MAIDAYEIPTSNAELWLERPGHRIHFFPYATAAAPWALRGAKGKAGSVWNGEFSQASRPELAADKQRRHRITGCGEQGKKQMRDRVKENLVGGEVVVMVEME